MHIFWYSLMGILQGLTEFLPVSSSGHLSAARNLISRWAPGGTESILHAPPLLMEVCLHAGTLAAIVLIYRKDIRHLLKGFFRAAYATVSGRGPEIWRTDSGARMALVVIAGSVPTAVIALAIEPAAIQISGSLMLLGITYLVLTALLFFTRWLEGGDSDAGLKTALLIGVAQGISVIPGISRSGLTIATGLFVKLRRDEAARVSFLMSIPAVAGATVLKAVEFSGEIGGSAIGGYLAGAVVAFITGCVALKVLIKMVQKGRLWWFAPYTAVVGFVLVILS